MQITHFHIKQYVPFDFAGIKEIESDLPASIQLIVGDNGSGKSSLLRELCPFPSSKPDYHAHGYKQLSIIHKGEEYELISDFGNKKSVHSFKRNNEELNLSGISTIQTELAETYLGYTKLIHDLTHLNLRMCKMSKMERRQLLLAINPANLLFISDKHKKAQSVIRSLKDQLNRAYLRKKELEMKLVDESVVKCMLEEKTTLTEWTSELSNYIYVLTKDLDTLRAQHSTELNSPSPTVDREQIRQLCKNINKFLTTCCTITRDNLEEQYRTITHELNTIQDDIQRCMLDSQELVGELEKLRAHLENSKHLTQRTELEKKVLEYETILGANHIKIEVSRCVPSDALNRYNEEIVYLEKALNDVLQYPAVKRIWFPTEVSKLKIKSQAYKWKMDRSDEHYTEVEHRLKEIEDKLAHLPPLKEEEGCLTCAFQTKYMQRHNELTREASTLSKELTKYKQVRHYRVKAYQQMLAVIISQDDLSKLAEFVYVNTSSTYFRNYYDKRELFDRIKNNPISVINELNFLVTESKLFWYQKEIAEKKQQLEQQLITLQSSQNLSEDFIVSTIKEKEVKHGQIVAQLVALSGMQSSKSSIQNKYMKLLKAKKRTEELMTLTETAIRYQEVAWAINIREKVKSICEELRTEQLMKLRDIENMLVEQNNLKVIYQDEILRSIEQLEVQKKQYEELEKYLSPTTGFPHRYTVNYVNKLLITVNKIISQVWSYDLSIVPIDKDEPIDFLFRVNVGHNAVVSDISHCSKGQSAMIDIAWTLAIMIHLGLNDYPLYLDECDEGFDPLHKQKLLEWLRMIVDKQYVRQIFLINHSAILFSGFNDAAVIALREENVVVTDTKNKYTKITRR